MLARRDGGVPQRRHRRGAEHGGRAQRQAELPVIIQAPREHVAVDRAREGRVRARVDVRQPAIGSASVNVLTLDLHDAFPDCVACLASHKLSCLPICCRWYGSNLLMYTLTSDDITEDCALDPNSDWELTIA